MAPKEAEDTFFHKVSGKERKGTIWNEKDKKGQMKPRKDIQRHEDAKKDKGCNDIGTNEGDTVGDWTAPRQ